MSIDHDDRDPELKARMKARRFVGVISTRLHSGREAEVLYLKDTARGRVSLVTAAMTEEPEEELLDPYLKFEDDVPEGVYRNALAYAKEQCGDEEKAVAVLDAILTSILIRDEEWRQPDPQDLEEDLGTDTDEDANLLAFEAFTSDVSEETGEGADFEVFKLDSPEAPGRLKQAIDDFLADPSVPDEEEE